MRTKSSVGIPFLTNERRISGIRPPARAARAPKIPAVPLLRSALAIVTEAARALAAARLGLVTDHRDRVGLADDPECLDAVLVDHPADPDVAMRPRFRRDGGRIRALIERELGKVDHQDIATGW